MFKLQRFALLALCTALSAFGLSACGEDPVFVGFPAEDAPSDSSEGDVSGADAADDLVVADSALDSAEDADVTRDSEADADAELDLDPDLDVDVDVVPDAEPVCGDDTRNPGELCDGSDLGDAVCADFAFDGGTLSCTDDCLGYDFDACTVETPAECGDESRDDGELCDGSDLNDVSCVGLGFAGGELTCREDCAGFVLDACEEAATCGDETIDDGELCDGSELEITCSDLGYEGGSLRCGADCVSYLTDGCTGGGEPVCGDDTLDAGELCDGSELEADCTDLGFDRGTLGCREDCAGYVTDECETDEPVCGDGVRDPGELCDDGEVPSTCEELGFDRGTLGCAPGCFGYDTSLCVNDAVCGDEVAEEEEVCDREDLRDETCRTRGFESGTLRCELDCTAFDTGACVVPTECGSGTREVGEVCDGDDLGGATCESRGFESGDLACREDCTGFDESDCIAACVPECGARRCGPDPICGDSCGDCDTGEFCNDSGMCELDGDRGPTILRFNTDVFDLSDGETVTFIAVVTDPDGIDDLIGGTLDDPVTELSYGSFATSSSEGAYGLTLTWEQIHRVRPIDFLDEEPRTFEAVFFDVGGNNASARLDITLTCDGNFACDGVCVAAGTTDDCTACDDFCIEGALCGAAGCTCETWEGACDDICTDLRTTTDCGGCGNVCAPGGSCVDGGCVCDVDEAVCDGVCTSLLTTLNCSECGNACASGGSCVGGECVCDLDEAVCGDVCTDITTTTNCGECGNSCAPGAVCTDGECACAGELDAVCDGTCVDLDTDDNCGECGNVCLGDSSCDDRACICERPDMYCPGVGCVDPSWIDSCGACDTECTLSYETCTSEGCDRALQGDIRTNELGYTDVRFGSNWRPLCQIFSFQQAEGACESIGMDLEYFERDVSRSDHTDGAGIQVDFFCPGDNLSSLGECDLSYEFCGGGFDGYYSTVHCIESRTPADDGDARFDPEGRPQVFFDDRWWTLTWGFGYFRDDAAEVFCNSMGLDFVSRAEGVPTTVDDGFCMGAFECTGSESSLADCVEYGWGQLDCGLPGLERVDIVCE